MILQCYEPLEIEVGKGQVIKGFENALLGMKKGEEKEVTIPQEEGYGHRAPSLVKNIPMDVFDGGGVTPKVGQFLDTQVGICKVTNINPSDIEVDFNGPLAGETLVFEIAGEEIIK